MRSSTLKILYGVQATGQGHITRAHVMAPALAKVGAEVDFLFSGRSRKKLFDMAAFGNFRTRRGVTFAFADGHVNRLQTVFNTASSQALYDAARLDLKRYDLIVTDFEPVTAWAALGTGKPVIGLGHQYAFDHDIPKAGFNRFSAFSMRHFAPAKTALGVHWHHFGQPILPPIITPPVTVTAQPNKIVVYLNFENLADVKNLLRDFTAHDFYIYHAAIKTDDDDGHLKMRTLSPRFAADIADCAGIICGGGFELPTEALHTGTKLLVKAMDGQPEQQSNALALTQLGLGEAMATLDNRTVAAWLDKTAGPRVVYPDTGTAVAEWIARGDWRDPAALVAELWPQVRGLEHLPRF